MSHQEKESIKSINYKYTYADHNGDDVLMSKGSDFKPSAPIVAREDLFSTLFSECVKADHHRQTIEKNTKNSYGNISKSFVKWFQDKVCSSAH